MKDLSILYINSGFRSFTAILANKNRELLGLIHRDFTSYGNSERELELVNMRSDIVNMVCEGAKKSGITSIEIQCKGPLYPRLIDMNALANNGINVILIKDKTPVPHNGCYPLKRVRINKR